MWAYGTQRVEALSIDDVVAGYTKRMGEAAGIIIDKVTRAILLAATTNVVTTDNGSPLSITLLRKAVHKLKGENGKPFKFGGKSRFVGIVGTDAMYDLWADSTLQAAMQYGYGNNLADNEANLLDGMIMPELDVVGVRLFESTLADATGGGGSACNTSATIVLAQDAYSVVEQDENSMKHYFIPSGQSDKSDVLALRWYMGWKAVHNAMVTNPEHMCVIRHAAIGG